MLYRNYADKMYNICLMYADSEDSANDILQDGFIKVFRNLKKFKFEGSFEGWIRRIIVNTALEHYRKKKRETEALQTIGEFSNLVMEEIIDKINAKELVKLVNQLPSRASMVLKLYAIEGYKHHEISQLMGISEGTSKSQLNRARQLLKEAITKLNG
ncbi:MAG: sigma-70 family RNA polymerase sigma factor [Bacteroidales bacterium]|nr:sigma-70 family RNA polymerase sigma factor [Bacteroidales bacterium]